MCSNSKRTCSTRIWCRSSRSCRGKSNLWINLTNSSCKIRWWCSSNWRSRKYCMESRRKACSTGITTRKNECKSCKILITLLCNPSDHNNILKTMKNQEMRVKINFNMKLRSTQEWIQETFSRGKSMNKCKECNITKSTWTFWTSRWWTKRAESRLSSSRTCMRNRWCLIRKASRDLDMGVSSLNNSIRKDKGTTSIDDTNTNDLCTS